MPKSNLRGFVTDIPPYFAVSKSRETFIELTESELNQCSSSVRKRCTTGLPMRLKEAPTCLSSLFFGNIKLARDLCKRTITKHQSAYAFRIPQTHTWLLNLAKSTPVKLFCMGRHPEQPKTFLHEAQAGTHSWRVPPHCKMLVKDELEIPYALEGTSKTKWTEGGRDIIIKLDDLFSTDDMKILVNHPHQNSTELDSTFAKINHRPIDFDNLMGQLKQVDSTIEETPLLWHHFRRPSTWSTIFSTILLIIIPIIGYVLCRCCKNRKSFILYPALRRNPLRATEEVELQPVKTEPTEDEPMIIGETSERPNF